MRRDAGPDEVGKAVRVEIAGGADRVTRTDVGDGLGECCRGPAHAAEAGSRRPIPPALVLCVAATVGDVIAFKLG